MRSASLFALVLLGCPSSVPDPDLTPESPTPFTVIDWEKSQPDIAQQDVRGFRELRAIAHLHSHWSHDACDGDPQPGGVPDEACLQDLRDGLCTTRMDVAFMSDHPGHALETDYATLLLLRDGDEPVAGPNGDPIANRITCADGHQVLLLPGIESGDMMPFALDAHVEDGYGPMTAEQYDKIDDAGGVKWVAHTETRDVAQLAEVGVEGIELYQLHANLAPDLREEFLGLDPFGFLADVGPFFFAESHGLTDPPHPDLAPLGFLLLNEPSIVALETLGQDGRVGVTGGTDAHQNVFPSDAGDFERIDSYRRMMRWFNNRLRVELAEDALPTPAQVEAALREARAHVAFEVFGTPVGFDMRVEGSAAGELGDEVPFAADLEVVVQPPTLDPRSPRADVAPIVTTRIYFADTSGRTLLAEAEGDAAVRAAVPGPGVVRAEIWIQPLHLVPYLGELADEYSQRTVPWLQTGGIFIMEGN